MSTVELITALYERGIRKMAVVVRHAARHHARDDLQNELFVPLSDQGKSDAYEFGLRLPPAPLYRFYSSPLSRCIETAYQIEKGCIQQGRRTRVNEIAPHLAPFFIKNYSALVAQYAVEGPARVFERWLRGGLPADMLLPPAQAMHAQLAPILTGLAAQVAPCIDVSVTHDTNLYLVCQCCLGQRFEDGRPPGFLEGVVLFEEEGVVKGVNQLGGEPVQLLEEFYR
jgi:hypothetical protein